MNYRGRRRGGFIAESPRSIEAGTYTWQSKRLYIDLSGEYNLTRRIGIFASMRNLNDAVEDTERMGPNTPEHAQLRFARGFRRTLDVWRQGDVLRPTSGVRCRARLPNGARGLARDRA